MFFHNLLQVAGKRPCPAATASHPPAREGELDAPLESALLYGKITNNVLRSDSQSRV
jgi:hypothetical protein